MSLWLYLHFPALQLDAMLSPNRGQEEPAASEGPWAIVDEPKNTLVQVNDQAAAQGVEVGMGLASAAVLCRDLQLAPYQHGLEVKKLREIAHWLYDVSADIVLQEPSGLLLRVSRMLRFYGGLASYWRVVQQQLESLPYQYWAATGDTPLSARVLARAGFPCISDNVQSLRRHCAEQSIWKTDLPPAQLEKMERLGIRCLSELCDIPLKALSRRFDSGVVQYIGRLTGALKHPVAFYQPPEHFQHHLELFYEIENTQVLQHPMRRQLDLLEAFLRRRDCLCSQISFRLHQRNDASLVVKVGSAQAEYQAEKWLELTQLTLEQYTLDAPVYALTLQVDSTLAKGAQNDELFVGRRGKLNGRQLVSLLQARLGEEAVTGLKAEDDFRPEYASVRCPPFASEPASTHQRRVATSFLRPTFLLSKPELLHETVSITQGPERITTGWWDQNASVRDYYIARNKSGQWCWVFRTPGPGANRHWYLHGYFS